MSPDSLITMGVSALVSLAIGFGSSYVGLRIFVARIDERMKHSASVMELALLTARVDVLERIVGGTNGGIVLDLHQLKNNLARLVAGFSDVR